MTPLPATGGESYSIADDAYSEYVHWFDMPWG